MREALSTFDSGPKKNRYVHIGTKGGGWITLTLLDAQPDQPNLTAFKAELNATYPMTKSDHLRNAGAVGTATALISLLIWVIHRFVRLHSCMFLQLFDSSILALNTGCVVAGDQGVTTRVHVCRRLHPFWHR